VNIPANLVQHHKDLIFEIVQNPRRKQGHFSFKGELVILLVIVSFYSKNNVFVPTIILCDHLSALFNELKEE